MGQDCTTTQILSTCAHCGETVEYTAGTWTGDDGAIYCDTKRPMQHTVDLSHAFSHMTQQG